MTTKDVCTKNLLNIKIPDTKFIKLSVKKQFRATILSFHIFREHRFQQLEKKLLHLVLNQFVIRLLICLCLWNISAYSYSQHLPSDMKTDFLNEGRQRLNDTIDKRTATEYPFVIGRLCKPVLDKFQHPYYNMNEWINGSIVFKDKTYEVERLKFDIEKDELIYLMYSNTDLKSYHIALDYNFITGFSILNASFKYFDDLKNIFGLGMRKGYYEVVYDGELKFLVSRIKSHSISDNASQIVYNETIRMYLIKKGKALQVRSKTGLLHLIKDKKKEVKTFIKSNNLKMNRFNYSSANKILSYYENLDKK